MGKDVCDIKNWLFNYMHSLASLFPIIYLFIYLCARKADRVYRWIWKKQWCANVWEWTYVLHEMCGLATGRKIIFFICWLSVSFLLFSLGCRSLMRDLKPDALTSRWWDGGQFNDMTQVFFPVIIMLQIVYLHLKHK